MQLTYTVEVERFEGALPAYYRDADGDGFGNPADTVHAPSAPEGYGENNTDCNDNDTRIHPGAQEICGDTIDQDCNEADLPCDFTIRGVVTGSGMTPIVGATVSIGTGTVTTSTDVNGSFSAGVAQTELLTRPADTVFPIKVTKDGYATGYANVLYEEGKFSYQVEIKLVAVSHRITDMDEVISGVEILSNGQNVGELTIPSTSLPSGVTQITGTITHIDPTSSEVASFPGSDFLAAPADGGQPVLLESFGVMEFDLKDQNGNPITSLPGPATVGMKVPAGLSVNEGDHIPLWYYDPATGLWQEEGEGIVEDRGAAGLWICGTVTHFTWWNYDRPIDTHACFKFTFVDNDTGNPITDLFWYGEGVTYSGVSPQRPCNCDGNDPQPPCSGESISSLTVKKSMPAGPPEQIRVYTMISGINYYLVRNGDGTYRVSTDSASATIFTVPVDNASCLSNYQVDLCRFLDSDDPVTGSGGPNEGNNGILPLQSFDRPPSVTCWTEPPYVQYVNGAFEPVTLYAEVTDDQHGITGQWYDPHGVPLPTTPDGPSPSGTIFTARWTPPDWWESSYAELRFAATGSDGTQGECWTGVELCRDRYVSFYGTVFDPDGSPAGPGVPVRIYRQGFDIIAYTDPYGYYSFDVASQGIPCWQCGMWNGESFNSTLEVNLEGCGNASSDLCYYCYDESGEWRQREMNIRLIEETDGCSLEMVDESGYPLSQCWGW
ncbi:MAG: astroprincin family protein [bacterium]